MTEMVARLAETAPVPAVAVSVFDRWEVRAATVVGAGRDDWWDLASLTKVLVTLPEVLELVPDPRVRLGDVWARAAGHPIGSATVAALLSHGAGLPVTARFHEHSRGADAIVEAALRTPLEHRATAVYSDIGFLLLGALVEHLPVRRWPCSPSGEVTSGWAPRRARPCRPRTARSGGV